MNYRSLESQGLSPEVSSAPRPRTTLRRLRRSHRVGTEGSDPQWGRSTSSLSPLSGLGILRQSTFRSPSLSHRCPGLSLTAVRPSLSFVYVCMYAFSEDQVFHPGATQEMYLKVPRLPRSFALFPPKNLSHSV